MEERISEVAKAVFTTLGLESNFKTGHSSHAKGGTYFSCSVFGVTIKLEENSYDYDDKYNYMISIKKNLFSAIAADAEIIKDVTTTVRKIIVKNLRIQIAQEIGNDELEIFGI